MRLTEQELIQELRGSWKGSARTWLTPDSEPTHNEFSATFRPLFDGPSLICEYTSMVGDHPADGVILIGKDISGSGLSMSWCDTFHTTSDVMVLLQDEKVDELVFKGAYSAGSETWGWRVAYSMEEKERLKVTHFNVLPSGEQVVAVEIACVRSSA